MPSDTLPRELRDLMRAPSVMLDHCAICGRPGPLNQHHIVRRGAGRVFRGGVEVPKPTITLCGNGNALTDADGRYYCHGLAHHQMLHFRWCAAPPDFFEDNGNAQHGGGHLEYLRTREPTKYHRALEERGWRKVRTT